MSFCAYTLRAILISAAKIQQKNDIRKYVCHFSEILVRFLFPYLYVTVSFLSPAEHIAEKSYNYLRMSDFFCTFALVIRYEQ